MPMHLATRTDLDRVRRTGGYATALCGLVVEPIFATSRLLDAQCLACLAECSCSSAPTPCATCADLEV